MSKGTGLWKLVLGGTVLSLSIAGGLYLSVPKGAELELANAKAAEGDYERSLYGVPKLDMGHYKLDEDQYFKYQVDGTLDISRENPSSIPSWMTEYELWSTDEMFDEDRIAFAERQDAILVALGKERVETEPSGEDVEGDEDVENVEGDGEVAEGADAVEGDVSEVESGVSNEDTEEVDGSGTTDNESSILEGDGDIESVPGKSVSKKAGEDEEVTVEGEQ